MRYHSLYMDAPRGMTLIDTLVGTALILIVFLALLGLLRASLLISSSAKAKAGATTVASAQVERIRSLPYNSVGTLGGIPAGFIEQYATTTLNGIPYGVHTLIQYVDDPADGTGSGDENGIPADYKRVRVKATYLFRDTLREVSLVTNVAPASVETTVGGGTLRINVVNADGTGVPGATVRVENPSVAAAIDFATFTDAAGLVTLPGAPASDDYRITVSKDGYSSAETYPRDGTNQNPTPGYLTVAESQTTTGTFSIDALASLTLRTFSAVEDASWADTFPDATGVAELAQAQVMDGALTLAGSLSGHARSVAVAPEYLNRWTSVSAGVSVPADAGVLIRVTDDAGGFLPDSVLPGNAAGFTSFPIDLSGVSTTTYPSLSLWADLSASDPAASPQVLDWTVAYREGPLPEPNVPFTLTGAKQKGTTGGGAPIYKTVISGATDASGARTLPLEWDVYTLTLSGHAMVSASTSPPYTLSPGMSEESHIIVE